MPESIFAAEANGAGSPRLPRRRASICVRLAALACAMLAVQGCAVSPPGGETAGWSPGASARVGNGTASSYATFDANGAPRAIGIAFQASALDGLPTTHSDGHHCFDRNNDGAIDPVKECFGAHEWVIPLPSEAARREDMPFKWIGLNWNPNGHIPPGIYDRPHFDVHFYIDSIENVFAIKPGTCGPEFVRCDQFKRALKPVPANYMHADYTNVEAVAPAMGNHLIDPKSPEFNGKRFTRTWIYGVYDGRVTFYEEMLTRAYLLSRPDSCFPLKTPPAVGLRGYYPTQSCIRYLPESDLYTVSMEGFVLREASPPASKS